MNGNRLSPDSGEIHLYYADLRYYRVKKPETLLIPDEAERAGRYRFEADSLHYVQARCLLREVLSFYKKCTPEEIIFEYTTHGKPFLKGEPLGGVQFNVSHSGDMVAVAVSCGRRVGIDIEKIRDDILESDPSLRLFSETESAAIRNSRGHAKAELFLRIWTRKEALLKATGDGIGGLPDSPDLLNTTDISLNGTVWQVYDLKISPGYSAALATEGTGNIVRIESFLLTRSVPAFPLIGKE
jgi:4'-phosphopantetheinyl transferase